MLRALFVVLNHFFWTGLLGSFCLIAGPFDRSGKSVHFMIRLWARIILKVSGVQVKVIGLDRLDPHSEYVFACNHESAFDIPVCYAGIPYRFVPVAKKELKNIPFLGWVMQLGKYIFIDRTHYRSALTTLQKAVESLRKYPRSILLYPEGTRSTDGKIHSFKTGGLNMALKLEMPVVPVALCGTRNISPKKAFKITPGEVEVRLGELISPLSWKQRNKSEFARFVREKVVALKNDWLSKKNFISGGGDSETFLKTESSESLTR